MSGADQAPITSCEVRLDMRMNFPTQITLFAFLGCTLVNCQGNTLTFKQKNPGDPIETAVMNFGDMSAEAPSAGILPKTFPAKQLSGKVVRFSQKGQQNQYWFFPEMAGSDNTAVIQMEVKQTTEKGGAPVDKTQETKVLYNKYKNRISRLIMKSYQALTEKDYKTAIELADQTSKIDPELAAPFVLKGLAYMSSGEKDKAITALTQAYSLEPDDQDINELLKALQ